MTISGPGKTHSKILGEAQVNHIYARPGIEVWKLAAIIRFNWSKRKNTLLLSMKSWLVNRDPYNGLL